MATRRPFEPPRAAHRYLTRWAALFDARAWEALATIDRAATRSPSTMAYLRSLRSSGCRVESWTIKPFVLPRWSIFRTYTLEPAPTLWCDLVLARARGNGTTIWLALAPYGRGYRQCDYVEKARDLALRGGAQRTGRAARRG